MDTPAFKATALKHRPQAFADLIGQEHVSTTLCNAIRNSRIAHAYLFSGPRGVGKTSAARILAKSLNCAEGPTDRPCGVCDNCREITAGSSLDVMEIDGASNRGIDQIRELRERVNFSPVKSRYRIYVIDEVHMLTNEAFNALLKTLEEPPAHVVFIFATTEAARVKITIRSRCQHYRFRRIAVQAIAAHLGTICAGEGHQGTTEALAMVARAAEGSMRDAQSLLDQVVAYAGGAFGAEHVREIAGILGSSVYFDCLTFILERDTRALVETIGRLDDAGVDLGQFATELALLLRNLILAAEGAEAEALEMPAEDHEKLLSLHDPSGEDGLSVDDALLLGDLVLSLARELAASSNPRRILELGALRLVGFRNQVRPEELWGRIEALARRLDGGIPGSGAPSRPAPVASGAPSRPAPVVASGAPSRPVPTAASGAPSRPVPVAASGAPSRPVPVAASGAPSRPVPTAASGPLPIEIVGGTHQAQAAGAPAAMPPSVVPSEESRPLNLDAEDLLRELDGYAERRNPMLSALIKNACRVELAADALVLYYVPEHSFHKSQLETQYRELVEGLLSEKAGRALGLVCRIEQQPLAAVPPLRPGALPGPAPAEPADVAGGDDPDPAEEVRQAFRGEYVEDDSFTEEPGE